MDKTLSIKLLFEKYGKILTYNYIDHTEEDGNHYYDLKDRKTNEILCMDGESCAVVDDSTERIRLQNSDGENVVEFALAKEEFDIATF